MNFLESRSPTERISVGVLETLQNREPFRRQPRMRIQSVETCWQSFAVSNLGSKPSGRGRARFHTRALILSRESVNLPHVAHKYFVGHFHWTIVIACELVLLWNLAFSAIRNFYRSLYVAFNYCLACDGLRESDCIRIAWRRMQLRHIEITVTVGLHHAPKKLTIRCGDRRLGPSIWVS